MKKTLQNLIFFYSKKLICILCLFGLLATTTMAQTTFTWNGTAWSPLLSTITSTDNVILDATTTLPAIADVSVSISCASLEVIGGPINIGSSISTTGLQTYQTPVTLTGNFPLASNGSLITFNSTVDGNAGANNLWIIGGSVAVFNGNVSNVNRIEVFGDVTFNGTVTGVANYLSVTGAATLNGGTIMTNTYQTYSGSVTLGANTTLTTTNSNVTFNGAVTGNYSLTVNPGSGTVQVGANITTAGSQNYAGTVNLTGSRTLNATGATATITAPTLNLNGNNVTIIAAGGINITAITTLPTAYTYWTSATASDPGGAGTLYTPSGSNPPFSNGAYGYIRIERFNGIALDKSGTQTFTAATYGYGAQTPLNVTVSNIGADPTGTLTVALSGTNPGSFTLSTGTIASIATGSSTTFTVRPNTGLTVGTYTATVTVSGTGLASQTFNVSFTVNQKPVTITGITATRVYNTTNFFGNPLIDLTSATINTLETGDVVTITKVGVEGTLPSANAGTSGNLTVTAGAFALGGTHAANYNLTAQPTVAASITKANTTTVVTTGGTTTYGQLINFSATVTATPPGAGIPTGSVTYYMNVPFPLPPILSSLLPFPWAISSAIPLDGSGVATISINLSSAIAFIAGSLLSDLFAAIVGNNILFYAEYSGDDNFNTSTSLNANHTISKATPVITQPISLTATYGETLNVLETQLPTASNDATPIPGTFYWEVPNPALTTVGTVAASPNTTHTVLFAPANPALYDTVWAVTTTIAVSAKSVTISGVTATKIYDGTDAFTDIHIDLSGASISGVISPDVVNINKTGVTGTFGPGVGTGTLTLTNDFTLSGAQASNYTIPVQPTVAASITKATPTITLITPDPTTITLDETTPPALNCSATLTGVDPMDTITFTLVYNGATVYTEFILVNGNDIYATTTGYILPTTETVTGIYQWNVTYSGDANHDGITVENSVEGQVTVFAASPTLALHATPEDSHIRPGDVELIAILTGAYPDQSGWTITFNVNGTDVGTATTNASGLATYIIPKPPAATHVFTASFSGDGNNNATSDIIDGYEIFCPELSYQGYDYKITRLAGLCWTDNMRNKNYENGEPIPFAKAYQENDDNGEIFGLLYDWYSATGTPGSAIMFASYTTEPLVQGICPEGWHIPTQEELAQLMYFSATALKSADHWIAPGADNLDFTSLPAGTYNSATEKFVDLYGSTGYWSCTPVSGTNAHGFFLTYYCEYIQDMITIKTDGLSVRCVMD